MIKLNLPYPPSVNHYWIERAVPTKTGKHRVMKCLGSKGRKFRQDVIDIVTDLEIKNIPLLTDNVSVTILATPPDRRRRDIDNILKAILDALEHAGVYNNDCQVRKLTASKLPPVKGGLIEITIEETSDES